MVRGGIRERVCWVKIRSGLEKLALWMFDVLQEYFNLFTQFVHNVLYFVIRLQRKCKKEIQMKKGLDASILKIIAIITMVIDHISWGFFDFIHGKAICFTLSGG